MGTLDLIWNLDQESKLRVLEEQVVLLENRIKILEQWIVHMNPNAGTGEQVASEFQKTAENKGEVS